MQKSGLTVAPQIVAIAIAWASCGYGCNNADPICRPAPRGRYTFEWSSISGNCDRALIPSEFGFPHVDDYPNVNPIDLPCARLEERGCTFVLPDDQCSAASKCAHTVGDHRVTYCGTLHQTSKTSVPGRFEGDLRVSVFDLYPMTSTLRQICDARVHAKLTALRDGGIDGQQLPVDGSADGAHGP